MKKIILLLFLLVPLLLYSQQWYPMDVGVINNQQVCAVLDISEYQGKIIIGGYFKKTNATVLNSIAQWDGFHWQPMGVGVWITLAPDSAGTLRSLAQFKGKFYASGVIGGAGGSHINDPAHTVLNITKWDNTDWFPLSPPPLASGVNQECVALGVYNNNLYLGGSFGNSFDSLGGISTVGVSKWNDTIFSAVGQLAGDFPPNGDFAICNFCNYKNKLIAGGYFTSINGSPYGSYSGIAAWNDTAWSAMGVGFNNAVFSLAVLDDTLYAAGIFTATRDSVTTLNYIAKWDGTQWTQVGEGLNDTVFSLCVDSATNTLYAGGAFTQTGLGVQAKHIAQWTGTNWQQVSGGTNGDVNAMYSLDSNLYVGGTFTEVGNSVSANNIACWGTHSPLGIQKYPENYAVSVYPNPANGIFTISTEGSKIKEVKVFDVLGEEIQKQVQNDNSVTIDMKGVSKGIYFVQITYFDNLSMTNMVNKKVVVE